MVLYILRRTAVAAAEIKVVWHGSAGTRYDAGVGDGRIAKIAPSKKREETSSDRKPGSDQGNR
jgi:hypothetical protein